MREIAQALTERSFEELERIAFMAPKDQDRIKAIEIILDRAYGKAPQPIDGDGDGGPINARVQIVFVKPSEAPHE